MTSNDLAVGGGAPSSAALDVRPTRREMVTAAIRYWEPRRLVYNGALAAIVIGYFRAALPESREALTTDSLLVLFVLAVMANLLYCAAYVVDLFAQMSAFRVEWFKVRWVLLAIGTVLAAVFARFVMLTFLDSLPNG